MHICIEKERSTAKQREMLSTHVVEWMFKEKNVNLLKHETDFCFFLFLSELRNKLYVVKREITRSDQTPSQD